MNAEILYNIIWYNDIFASSIKKVFHVSSLTWMATICTDFAKQVNEQKHKLFQYIYWQNTNQVHFIQMIITHEIWH